MTEPDRLVAMSFKLGKVQGYAEAIRDMQKQLPEVTTAYAEDLSKLLAAYIKTTSESESR